MLFFAVEGLLLFAVEDLLLLFMEMVIALLLQGGGFVVLEMVIALLLQSFGGAYSGGKRKLSVGKNEYNWIMRVLLEGKHLVSFTCFVSWNCN